MPINYTYELDAGDEPPTPVQDWAIEKAAQAVQGFFARHPDETFYETQLKVIFEDDFFHWVTTNALRHLVTTGVLASDLVREKPFPFRFYRLPRHRYWVRQSKEIIKLVQEFSDPIFTKALGQHGEMMFDAALPSGGFIPTGRDVQSYRGKTWTESDHNLDRCFEKDGIHYGVEIKNTIPYIPRDELTIKLKMCAFFDVRPLFIVRMHPKTYIHEIDEAGGYGLVFKHQLYPHGHAEFAKRVRARLLLSVDSPRAIASGTIDRLVAWHKNHPR